ncbi:protein LYK2 [Diospyros lotus]|uniref:protein LYK2 n=1 Tax=Diospyros lotus TaxID=55363 RepID=UPI002250E2FF|nr:protein LYK2 [Diospyros lotus]
MYPSAAMFTKRQLNLSLSLVFFLWAVISALGQALLGCDPASPEASGYRCHGNGSPDQCRTFAVLRANSYYSSLLNLTSFFGIDRLALQQANSFSDGTESLPIDRPLLIPLDCKCDGAFFHAVLRRTAIEGESFHGIAESLEGLTSCKSIQEKNPGVQAWNLRDKLQLLIPLACACPDSSQTKLLLSYPVTRGDTIFGLALKFNVTPESIIAVNNRSGTSFKPENLLPFSTVLIPAKGRPVFSPPAIPNLGLLYPHKRKPKMWKVGVYIGVSGLVFGAGIATAAAFLVIQRRKKKQMRKMADLELQQLGLSIRTTSEKKVSFDQGSQDTLDGRIVDSTPHKMVLEAYTIEELRKATEDFSSSNLIEGLVFHGRLNGKNLAIKRTQRETLSKVDFSLFQDATHHHPNIIRLMGTCSREVSNSFLVFEYAKNGSLKDWLHGGLAMKSQFIASCYCFLNWNQRLRICLDVATALQYMHHIMIPSYVHRNIRSRNIFLDEEFNAKVGNFGMAACVEDLTENQPLSWNKGYLAPEYLQKGIVSRSLDIFAYGVMVLEVLSGKTAITRGNEEREDSVWLSQKIKSILESENAEDLRGWMDNALGEKYSFDAAVTLANLARACVDDDPALRPSAGEIMEKVSRLVEELPEGEPSTSICESSSKPLVQAARN